MNKILETHYNLSNNIYQVRIFEEDFEEYVKHILETKEGNATKIINGIDNIQGCTLGKPEKIVEIIQSIKGYSLIFKKYNDFNQSEVIVSLVVIDDN